MFQQLSERLFALGQRVSKRSRLGEKDVRNAVREMRSVLLEADVALPVVQELLQKVRRRALGREVAHSLKPGQVFVKIVHDELCTMLGEENAPLRVDDGFPAVVLMVGLQGSGKTTSSAKLGHSLHKQGKKVLLAAADTQRAAAQQQLQLLAEQAQLPCYSGEEGMSSEQIARHALEKARREGFELLIVDSAGRQHSDAALMAELGRLAVLLEPRECLLVVDSMAGQDALASAQEFARGAPLSGIVLSKADSDSRGGAALSARQVSGVPVKFLGTGEALDAWEIFHPQRLAGRLLGMGDVVSLVEKAESQLDEKRSRALLRKMRRPKQFNLEDFRSQLKEVRGMGGMEAIMQLLPGASGGMPPMQDERALVVMEAIINSMTPRERRHPEILNGSRKRRITRGSGTALQDINRLMKQFRQMRKMMGKMRGRDPRALENMLQGRVGQGRAGQGRAGLPPSRMP